MKQSTLNSISLIVVLGALIISAAATAQNSFGNDPQPRNDGRAQPRTNTYNIDENSDVRNIEDGPGSGGDDAPYSDDGGANNPPPRYNGGGRGVPQASSESQDFGVSPTDKLRPSDKTHGPTPSKIPGGLVVTTGALQKMLSDRQSGLVVLDVYGAPQMLPNAVHAMPASQGGSFNDETQKGYGQFLQQITGGDKNRPIVTYCAGVQCWLSYNAALRAIKLGYSNVLWYRGGLEAWTQAGLPTTSAQQQGGNDGRGQDGRSQDQDGRGQGQGQQRNSNQVGQRSGY